VCLPYYDFITVMFFSCLNKRSLFGKLLLDGVNDGGIFKGGDISGDFTCLDEFLKEASHDFS